MSFFIKGCKYALVTYAQCGDLDPWDVVHMFASHSAECIIGRELHANGGIHLHCFVDFGRQFSSRKADVFDVGGKHPNIEKSRGTPEKGYDYAIKDGDVVAGGLERPLSGQSGSGSGTARVIWTTITMAEDADEFWRLCHELAPEHVCRSFNSLAKYAEWRFRPVDEPYATPDGVWIDASKIDGINEWVAQASLGSGPLGLRLVLGLRPARTYLLLFVWAGLFPGALGYRTKVLTSLASLGSLTVCRRKSLVLCGATQLGKTVWARSLGSHIFFSGLYSGAEAMRYNDAQYAIFDDMQGGMTFVHGYKHWLGAQMHFQVKMLYKDPKIITWGKPCIWLCNWKEDPRLMDALDQDWLSENCIFVDLYEKIAGPISHANTE